MRKTLELQSIQINRFEQRKSVRVAVQDDEIADWCLHLSLLSYGLIDTLILKSSNEVLRLQTQPDTKKQKQSYSKVIVKDNEELVQINDGLINGWRLFFLTYYRDAESPVDHIDTEVSSVPKNLPYDSLWITVVIANWRR